MYVLGISGGVSRGAQDGAAALLRDGTVVAAVEEERLLRVKHARACLPEKAIRSVLDCEGISLRDVDALAYHGITYDGISEVLERFITSKFGYCPPIRLVHHHDAHAASAYYASGFDSAMIVTADLSGDGTSTQLAAGRDGTIEVLERIPKPNSFGIYYSGLTQFVGFERENDEYKVMGLASYGDRKSYDLGWLLSYSGEGYQLNPEGFRYQPGSPNPSRQEAIFSDLFVEHLGAPRLPDSPMSSVYENVAASGQEQLEQAYVHLVRRLHEETGLRKLCCAGGTSLNCVLNQRLMALDFVDELYIQPASSDAGVSLGAAYLVAADAGHKIQPLPHVFLGPSFTDDEIRGALRMAGVTWRECSDVAACAARLVAEDKIVGWFQGRMAFGPRALGNRSILANAHSETSKDIVNEKIKFREQFRPFAPSVVEEDVSRYFVGKLGASPYMTVTYDVRPEEQQVIPAVTHVDGTARIQSVAPCQNPLYYALLQELKRTTGHGIVLNTSFNVRGDPVVNTPYQALATFFGSGMDALLIGSFILEKQGT